LVKLGGGRGIGELAASSRTWTGRLKLRVLAALKPRFLAVVPDLADEAQEFLGDVPMEVLPNGVDTTRYARVDRSRKSTLRQKLGWGLDSHIFIYTGRFSTEKRLPWFLRLWQQTAGRRSLAVLVGDGPEKDALREISSKSAGRILVLDPQEDLPDLYGASDVFFLPSSSEGLSNALLEAMSSGLTPLASRVGGNAQTIVDGETGLLFGAEDESALKDAITRLESESGLSERLGLAAHDAVRKQYALESVVERLEHLYRS
jgi:glycosyltransferase involved in cell wall biosynthesis